TAFAQDSDRLARFEREGKAVAALSHPNILAIFDVGAEGGHAYAVMELPDGRVKILDFGLARTIDGTERALAGATGEATVFARRTDAGTVMGTVGYMAPEQVRGLTVDGRADIFALGTVL